MNASGFDQLVRQSGTMSRRDALKMLSMALLGGLFNWLRPSQAAKADTPVFQEVTGSEATADIGQAEANTDFQAFQTMIADLGYVVSETHVYEWVDTGVVTQKHVIRQFNGTNDVVKLAYHSVTDVSEAIIAIQEDTGGKSKTVSYRGTNGIYAGVPMIDQLPNKSFLPFVTGLVPSSLKATTTSDTAWTKNLPALSSGSIPGNVISMSSAADCTPEEQSRAQKICDASKNIAAACEARGLAGNIGAAQTVCSSFISNLDLYAICNANLLSSVLPYSSGNTQACETIMQLYSTFVCRSDACVCQTCDPTCQVCAPTMQGMACLPSQKCNSQACNYEQFPPTTWQCCISPVNGKVFGSCPQTTWCCEKDGNPACCILNLQCTTLGYSCW